tara:strand:+ start:15 stop:659 length:645 start_codon:yes stop_codon:yes gene_type:complete
MTGTELNTSLGLRMEDPTETVFTPQMKLDAINTAQRTVMNMIHNHYLTELQVTALNKVTDATGMITFDTIFGSGVNPLANRIAGIYDVTNGKWCSIVNTGELDNSYFTATTSSPTAHIWEDKIYLKPEDTVTINVWYIKPPTDFTNTEPSLASSCELNIALQEIVLDLAEAQLWRMDARSERAQVAYGNGIGMVKTLNDRYYADEGDTIGLRGS